MKHCHVVTVTINEFQSFNNSKHCMISLSDLYYALWIVSSSQIFGLMCQTSKLLFVLHKCLLIPVQCVIIINSHFLHVIIFFGSPVRVPQSPFDNALNFDISRVSNICWFRLFSSAWYPLCESLLHNLSMKCLCSEFLCRVKKLMMNTPVWTWE